LDCQLILSTKKENVGFYPCFNNEMIEKETSWE